VLATAASLAIVSGRLRLDPNVGSLLPDSGNAIALRRYVRAFGGGEFGVAFVHLDEEQRAGLTRLIFQEIAPKRPAHEVRFRRALAGVWRAMVET